MPTYRVERHGGTRRSQWRTLYEGDDEARARRVYDREAKKMREGRVVLAQDGKVIASEWSPSLRTRW